MLLNKKSLIKCYIFIRTHSQHQQQYATVCSETYIALMPIIGIKDSVEIANYTRTIFLTTATGFHTTCIK